MLLVEWWLVFKLNNKIKIEELQSYKKESSVFVSSRSRFSTELPAATSQVILESTGKEECFWEETNKKSSSLSLISLPNCSLGEIY
jgi:hypothetical protein